MTAGREEGIRKDLPVQSKSDPPRSAKKACKIMQKDSGPENPKSATLHVTHTNTGPPLAVFGSRLTQPQ